MAGQYFKALPYIRTGTAAVAPAQPVDLTYNADGKTFADYVAIQNTGAAVLYVNFDDGADFISIAVGGSFELEWRLATLYVKTLAGNATYQIVCTTGKQFRPF